MNKIIVVDNTMRLISSLLLGAVAGFLGWLAEKMFKNYMETSYYVLSATSSVLDYLEGAPEPETIVASDDGRASRTLVIPIEQQLPNEHQLPQIIPLGDFDACFIADYESWRETNEPSQRHEGGGGEPSQCDSRVQEASEEDTTTREESPSRVEPALQSQEEQLDTHQEQREPTEPQPGPALQAFQEPDSGTGLDGGAEGKAEPRQDSDARLPYRVSRPQRKKNLSLHAGSPFVLTGATSAIFVNSPMPTKIKV